MAVIRIAKTNLAVQSKPVAGVLFSKTNLAVQSKPVAGVLFSKTNLAVQSDPLTGYTIVADPGTYAVTGAAAAPKIGRKLQMYNALVANGRFSIDTSSWSVDGSDTIFTSINGVGVLNLGPAAAGGYAWQAIAVQPGRPYTLSAFLRPTNAYTLTASPGSYVIAGTPADISVDGASGVIFSGDNVIGRQYAQYTLSFDGYAYKRHNSGAAVQSGPWIVPQVGLSLYEVRATLVDGDTPGGTLNTWLDFAQTWGFTGVSIDTSCDISIEIRRKSDLVVVASGDVSIFAVGLA